MELFLSDNQQIFVQASRPLKEVDRKTFFTSLFQDRIGCCPCVIPTGHLTGVGLSRTGLLHPIMDAAQAIPNCRIILPLDNCDEIHLLLSASPVQALPACQRIIRQVHQSAGVWLSAGLGPYADRLREFSSALEEARKISQSFNLFALEGGVYTTLPVESAIRPYNMSAQEDQLYASILNGSETAIESAAGQLTQDLFSAGFFCLRQLGRLKILYHGMRINWMEKFRIRYPQTEHRITPPAFSFSGGFDARGIFSSQLFQADLYNDLWQVSRFYQKLSGQEDAGIHFIQQVKAYIDFSYAFPLSQQKIADQFYVNANYLSHSFKRFYRIGMTQYINQVRVQKAIELLADPVLTMRQISERVGFRDEKYFSRVFHQFTGQSPSIYRRSLTGDRRSAD